LAQGAHQIEFSGPVFGYEKHKLLGGARLFVLPSHSENFGLVVGEALACGTAVICSTGAPWQDLNTKKCGWWIPVARLDETLKEATSLPDESIREMGACGRAFVERCLSWDTTATKLCQLYENIINAE